MFNPHPHPVYSLMLFLAGGLSLAVMHMAWSRRHTVQCAYPVAFFSLGNAIWAIMYALHWSSTYRPTEFFWLDMTYLGVVIVPGTFFCFALCYTDRRDWFNRQRLLILALEPVLTLLFLWTDPLWGIFFDGKRHTLDAVIFDGGLWFWFHVVYSYGLILYAVAILVRAFLKLSGAYRGQLRMIVLGALIPMVTNASNMIGIDFTPNLDFTPVSFTLTGIFISIGIFRYQFLDLKPVAHDHLFASMSDAVIVLDAKKRVIDLNTQAQVLFHTSLSDTIGAEIKTLLNRIPEIPPNVHTLQDGHNEFSIQEPGRQHFEIVISPLPDHTGNNQGSILTFRDITWRKQAELKLMDAKCELEKKLEEISALQQRLREEAIRDYLTGLFNRRYLQETLERELSRAAREAKPLTLAMIDLDDFKKINDRFGHSTGDLVLINLGQVLMKFTRKEDIVCRYGGEEVVVVMPGAAQEDAYRRVDAWRQSYHSTPVQVSSLVFPVTFSAGIASFPEDGLNAPDLLMVADLRLYRAKATGKNRVCEQSCDTSVPLSTADPHLPVKAEKHPPPASELVD
jgi:diguanylate cyclase (GGDEF)-like protein/PAS domain S-box-containing protein